MGEPGSMNIKELDKYKRVFEYVVDTLPLEGMEFDIQQSNDPLISKLYSSLLSADRETINIRAKNNYHKLGIVGIYALFDPIYRDLIRWLLFQTRDVDLQAKPPKKWRVNR